MDIFFAGRWGTICSDGFSLSDARGLCHILTGSSSVLAYGAVGDDNLELVYIVYPPNSLLIPQLFGSVNFKLTSWKEAHASH